MQYKIPQNVRIEDKIVGPLTLKQLIILGVGGGITYAIYVALARVYYVEVWLVFTLPPGLLTLAFTFVKIKGIPFWQWITLVIEFFINPRKRTFSLGAGDHYEASIFAKNTIKEETKDGQMTKAQRDQERINNIGEITKMLDNFSMPEQPKPTQ